MIVFGDKVFVNREICCSIRASICACVSGLGKFQTTVEILGFCLLRKAVKDTSFVPFSKSGHLVCKIDSNKSHSSVDGNVLMNILQIITSSFSVGSFRID